MSGASGSSQQEMTAAARGERGAGPSGSPRSSVLVQDNNKRMSLLGPGDTLKPSMADAVELARAKSKLRASKVQEPERIGLPQLDFGSAEDYLEAVALDEAKQEREQRLERGVEALTEGETVEACLAQGTEHEEEQKRQRKQYQNYCFWQEAQDPASGCLYYYHSALQQTQWEPPESEGYLDVNGAYRYPPSAVAAAAANADVAQPAEQRTGWCYTDAFGFRQGPFSKEQLKAWAGAAQLSRDTEVWLQTAGNAAGTGPSDAPRSSLSQLFPEDFSTSTSADPYAAGASAPGAAGTSQPGGAAVEAAGGTTSSYGEWAAAALAGLPEDDEAVKLAQLAAAAGHTVEDMLQFNYSSAEASGKRKATDNGAPVATAVYNPRTGRIEQAQAEEDVNVYAGMESWFDIRTLEASLQAMQERKGKQLPPEVWKKLKARKEQVKQKVRKMEASWMYN